MKKYGFSRFKNTKENPLCLDDEGNFIEIEHRKRDGSAKPKVMKNEKNIREGIVCVLVMYKNTEYCLGFDDFWIMHICSFRMYAVLIFYA